MVWFKALVGGTMTDISELKGQVLWSITQSDDDDELLFTTIEGKQYRMYHYQD